MPKSASIQERTSPLKFDHFRWTIPHFTASNLSTKRPISGWLQRPLLQGHLPPKLRVTLVELRSRDLGTEDLFPSPNLEILELLRAGRVHAGLRREPGLDLRGQRSRPLLACASARRLSQKSARKESETLRKTPYKPPRRSECTYILQITNYYKY